MSNLTSLMELLCIGIGRNCFGCGGLGVAGACVTDRVVSRSPRARAVAMQWTESSLSREVPGIEPCAMHSYCVFLFVWSNAKTR